MSILKGHKHDRIEERRPFDAKGRYVSMQCIHADCSGSLKYQGDRFWSCDGLRDPERPDQDLIACEHFHYDGED